MDSENTYPKSFSQCLEELIQSALDNKTSADDGETARKWAIVRTELEKVHAYVLTLEE